MHLYKCVVSLVSLNRGLRQRLPFWRVVLLPGDFWHACESAIEYAEHGLFSAWERAVVWDSREIVPPIAPLTRGSTGACWELRKGRGYGASTACPSAMAEMARRTSWSMVTATFRTVPSAKAN